jgi:glycosyltransferase involved in cell wall biosynthesis
MKPPKRYRVFIGPYEIAGYYANLANGFKQIGIECDYITYTPHPSGYGGESKTPLLIRLSRFFNQFGGKPNKSFIFKALIAVPRELLISIWALSAIFKYDVFIFSFGQSLMPRYGWDLYILRILKKIVIMNIGHGSESRPPYIDGSHQSPDGAIQATPKRLRALSANIRKRVSFFERNVSYVVGGAWNTTNFAQRRLVSFLALGLPFCERTNDISSVAAMLPARHTGFRILHSPSHPAAKGSPLILKAIQSLKGKGYPIELVLLHGKPNDEVMVEIERCDFVVDQVYSDFPLAGFATEAAWFGKPAVVGGYGFDYLKTFVPEGMWPPSKTCHPAQIEQAIESLMVNREERLRLGAEAQMFVRKKWNTAEVARRYLRVIEGDVPDYWWLDPRSVTYLEGAGQPIERSKENIRKMVEQFGVASLQLGHRPNLEQAFLKFAEIEPKINA